ncbi:MAG: hypothetical protein AAGA48_34170 [Myxococcota bacterium]
MRGEGPVAAHGRPGLLRPPLLVSDLLEVTSLSGLSGLALLTDGATIWRNPKLGDATAQAFVDDTS